MRGFFSITVGAACATSAAFADSAPAPADLADYVDPAGVVLAIRTEFEAEGGRVRISVYENEAAFLERAAMKHQGIIDKNGVAAIPLYGLKPGDYAFVAYYDSNGDGRLNRSALGAPTEPYAFSNDVKPKLRKPRFEEAKVEVAPGEIVVMTMEK